MLGPAEGLVRRLPRASVVRVSPEEFTLDVMVGGLGRAAERYEQSTKSVDKVQEALCALFEALNWTVVVQDRLRDERGEEWADALGAGRTPTRFLDAMRFARNRIHHHWPDALILDQRGFVFPVRFPIPFFEWRWRDELTPRSTSTANDRGAECYALLLAGRPARVSLEWMVDLARAALGEIALADSDWTSAGSES